MVTVQDMIVVDVASFRHARNLYPFLHSLEILLRCRPPQATSEALIDHNHPLMQVKDTIGETIHKSELSYSSRHVFPQARWSTASSNPVNTSPKFLRI